MQKIYVEFEHEVNARKFTFKAEPNSPLVDAKEALLLVIKELGQIEDQVKAQQAQAEAEKPKEEVAAIEEPPKD